MASDCALLAAAVRAAILAKAPRRTVQAVASAVAGVLVRPAAASQPSHTPGRFAGSPPGDTDEADLSNRDAADLLEALRTTRRARRARKKERRRAARADATVPQTSSPTEPVSVAPSPTGAGGRAAKRRRDSELMPPPAGTAQRRDHATAFPSEEHRMVVDSSILPLSRPSGSGAESNAPSIQSDSDASSCPPMVGGDPLLRDDGTLRGSARRKRNSP